MEWNKFLEIYRDVIGRGAGAGKISHELLALPGRCARTDRCFMSAAPGSDHKDRSLGGFPTRADIDPSPNPRAAARIEKPSPKASLPASV